MNMDKLALSLLIGLVIGIPLGLYVSMVSNRHEAVKGGTLAQVFHALGAIILCGALPGVLVEVFTGAGFLNAVVFGLSSFALAFLSLCAYAIFERPTIKQAAAAEDRGWTAEKAKSSGL